MATAGIIKKAKTKGSRKGKREWVKNIDITGLESDLDQLRTEERLGGKLHERSNESLFTIDKAGDSKIRQSIKNKPLKVDEILKNQSAIPSPFNHSRTKPKSTVAVQNANGKTKFVSKAMKKQVEELAKQLAVAKPVVEGKKRKANEMKDLWGAREEPKTELDTNEYLEPVRKKDVKKPKLINDKLPISAVKVAEPGASYNPTFDDHQTLLGKALDVELKKESDREKAIKQLSYPPELDDLDDETFFDSDDEVEEDETDGEGQIVKKPVAPTKKKTQAERRRIEKRRQEEMELERKRLEKARKKEENRLSEIVSQVEQEVKQKEAVPEAKKKREKLRRVGPVPFKDQNIEIKLTEELTQGLRQLKPEGNILKDRFTSLQERAIIEPRVPRTRKLRYKRKETESHDYKRFDAETMKEFK
ncbi:Glioma tumor suppressor candidate region protein 2 [Phlyctochytrium planicorne]|nr:Glioma tumor suppressor candidate region protein 2 [Phlyctochytrium planicorne]